MADADQIEILRRGATVWNQWRKDNRNTHIKRGRFLRSSAVNFAPHQPDLRDADLRGADLRGLDLTWANLVGAELIGTDLSGADLQWASIDRANLLEANLAKATLRGAILSRSNLSKAILYKANLRESILHEAKLRGANFYLANLNDASLAGADLTESELSGTDLNGADLNQANLSSSRMGGTVLVNVDLRTVKGLETVQHSSGSFIGIETIYRSEGAIPHLFLRRAGVPDNFVEYMTALVGKAFEFYSCFISYSSKDADFAERLYADLQSNGVRCWFASEDLKIGDKLRPSFDEAIRLHDKLMVLLSEGSVRSPWVEKEVETAFEKERQQSRTVLIPIRLDDAVMETKEAWAADIRRTRHIGDFRAWKDHDRYKSAFDRLLRDLRACDDQ